MREILLKALNSVLKSAILASIIAFAAYFAGINVIMTFVISFVSQFIIFYLNGIYIDFKAAKVLKEQQLKELEILSRITFTINCAACKQSNQVVINANEENTFDCEHCKAKNSAYITAEAALVTTPISTNL